MPRRKTATQEDSDSEYTTEDTSYNEEEDMMENLVKKPQESVGRKQNQNKPKSPVQQKLKRKSTKKIRRNLQHQQQHQFQQQKLKMKKI